MAVNLDGATSVSVIDRDTSATAIQPVACWYECSSAVRVAGELKLNATSAAVISLDDIFVTGRMSGFKNRQTPGETTLRQVFAIVGRKPK